ncbi:TPA: hypothetical protein I8271_001741 [Kluyvera intermedia]|uniref:NADP-dependent oxidoreductase domain-containing protein n=2 Tax=Enterobacteriaceae TaxID=543 RepID=A0A9P3T5Y0_KLUIN|nr:hypothetical protein [Kluyvera intermedia]HAT2515357.1 hypothetical protein [Kluyvera intermedia]HAT2603122.1 hypothetical protein [Kluyvera intermedia]HAT2679990.1 hypothetical protein [Kluyvera intermedia]HAT2696400.1 hypothetical protein [Kluyvera intermedia]
MRRAHEYCLLSIVSHKNTLYYSIIKNTECKINPHTNTIPSSSIVRSDLKRGRGSMKKVLILGAAGSLARIATRYLLDNSQAQLTLYLRNSARLQNPEAPVQVALAWLLVQKPWIVPIPGMDKVAYIDDNLKAIDLELSAEDLANIEAQLASIKIQGNRLDDGLLSMSE